jgi:hypothetical protein
MALRTCLHRLATRLSDVCFARRRSVIVLWRLRQTSDVAEAVCSVTEPTPGIFHVVLTHKGRCEIRRLVHGIDLLVCWSEGVKACLQADGWREVDVPKASRRVHRRTPHASHTIEIAAPDLRRGSQSP